MLGCSCVLFYGIFRFKSSIMAWASARKLEAERSPQCEEVRKEMHRAIEDGDETSVRKCLGAVPSLRLWLDPDDDVSALYKAIQKKAFRIHALLVSRDCALKGTKESSFYKTLSCLERAEIRRQRFFATEYKESYIHYLKSKSLSQTPCADFEARLERMYTKLISVGLISTILKVAATAPRLEIHFDFKSENVQRTTGCRGRSTRGLTFHEDQKVFIAGSAKEEEIWGTFTHEMSHLALYLVYRNNGKPYFRDDTEREHEYKAILNDIKRKENECIPSFRTECGEPKAEHPRTLEHDVHLLIQQAFFENEEEELIVRVAHVLAEYGSHDGNIVLERDVPELYHFFKNVMIPDMQTCIENRMSWVDFQRIEVENARLQIAFNTGKLNVVFETPLKRSVWENRLLHIFTGPELRLLEIMVHNAVQCTGQPYLFFEVNQLDFTLTDVLLECKCAFVLVTVHPNEDVKSILRNLSDTPYASETKVILLVEDIGKEDLISQVERETFFADKYKVHEDVKATFEHVTLSCKKQVFTNSHIKLQGQDVADFPEAMNIDTFLRCVDTTIFLKLCESGNLDLGPPLHELDKCVKNYYVERVCRRAVEINLNHCRLDDENEAFGLLGCPHDSVTKFLPRGYEAKANDNLTQFEKFVLLQQSRDYEALLENGHYRNKIVHLLHLNETRNGFLWTNSNGRLSHLPMTGNDNYTMETLLNVNERVVVVSGEPGMGKSVLASQLCTEIKNENRNRWVFYIDLPQRLSSVKTASLSLGYLCQVQKDGLEFALFEESLNRGRPFHVVVIFDAFDEINEKWRKDVLEIISFLIKTKVYKIYVLTRTVLKSKLQDALHTVSYALVPFSDENQEEFLTKYREQREHSTTTNAVVSQQFQKLYVSLKKADRTILENPLLLRMMAEMENGDLPQSDDYSSLLEIIDIPPDRSLYTVRIYMMFVEYKYLLYRIEKRKENVSLHAAQDDHDPAKPPFYASHGLLAMKCIFPQDILEALLNEDDLEKIEPDGRLIKDVADNRLKEGFVNGINEGSPVFVHKTFAEFFAAHYLLQKAKVKRHSNFGNEVVRLYGKRAYEGVMLFFDGLASASLPLHSAVMNNDVSYFEKPVIQREDMFKLDELKRTPLHVAALQADKNILDRLPVDDEMIKRDMFNTSPFGYAEIFFPWDTYLGCDGKWIISLRSENSSVRDRLNILCAQCSDEAVKYSNETLRKRGTYVGKRRFLDQVLFIAVKDDLQGVLDVYLRYFYPKKKRETLDKETLDQLEARTERSSRWSTELQVIDDADKVTDENKRTVPFYAKSEAVLKMLLPYCDMGIVDRYGNTMLHISAEEGNLETTQFHLAHSSVDATNKMGETPLHLSAHKGQEEVVKLLLPVYTSVNVLDYREKTPMDRCVRRGWWDIMRLLLLRTRIYDTHQIRTRTPLHVASGLSVLHAVTFFLSHITAHTPTSKGETCLDQACKHLCNGYSTLDVVRLVNVVKCLIPHSLVNSPDTLGSSPVYVWVTCSKRKVLQTLWPYLRHSDPESTLMVSRNLGFGKVNADFQEEIWCLKLLYLHLDAIVADRYDRTLPHRLVYNKLFCTAEVNYIDYMKLVLPHSNLCEDDYLWVTRIAGLRDDVVALYRRWSEMNNTDNMHIDDDEDTGVVDEGGNKMLLISAKEGDVEGVKLHLSHTSVCVTDNDGDTALHLSARNGHTSVVKLLVPFCTSVDKPNVHRDTPMHVCARKGHLDVVKLLFLRSRMSCRDEKGRTPLHVASKCGAVDIVTFLLPHSLANIPDFRKETCLRLSVVKGKLNVLRCLIPHALVTCRDREGKSPVQYAASHLFRDTAHHTILYTILPYSSDYDVRNLVLFYNSFSEEYSREQAFCVKLIVLRSDTYTKHERCSSVLCSFESGGCDSMGRRDRTYKNYLKLLLPHCSHYHHCVDAI